jgi:lysozyme
MTEGKSPDSNEIGSLQLKKLMRQLEIDEGRRLRVYLDSEGLRTIGIGHLIKKSDPPEIRDLKVGDLITKEQLIALFEADLAIAIHDFRIIFLEWKTFPAEVQEIIINMLFNLGRDRFLGFKHFIAAIYERNWVKAADEMQNSKWFHQVGNRAKRLATRMRTINASVSN